MGNIFSLDVASNCSSKQRVRALAGDDGALQYPVHNCRHKKNKTVQGGWRRRKSVLAHPARHNWKRRRPEQQMQIWPWYRSVHIPGSMQHIVIVVPADVQIHKAHYIAQKSGKLRA